MVREVIIILLAALRKFLIPIGIVVTGAVIAIMLLVFRQSPPKEFVKKAAALVTVIDAVQSDERVMISGFGTVESQRELEVKPQVSGHVVELHKNLQVGGRINEGEALFRIDPRDYQIAVDAQNAALTTAEFEYKLEEGNQVVAKREWELLGSDLKSSKLSRELALRKPHLKQKKAALDSAFSQLKKAELDLSRTVIKSPFNAVVLDESIEVGEFVGQQSTVMKISATDAFFILLKAPRKSLRWISLNADGSAKNAIVSVYQSIDTKNEQRWDAAFVRVLGDVDSAGRMAQILISVKNPLDANEDKQPLLLGSYVRIEIEGDVIPDVYALPLSALREDSKIFTVSETKQLVIKQVKPVFAHSNTVYVTGEIEDGDVVIVSPLKNALEGMLVEVQRD